MPKIDFQKLEKKLDAPRKSCWEIWNDAEVKKAFDFSEKYKEFLDKGKTEREVAVESVRLLEKVGFRRLDGFKKVKTGDKVYQVNREKNIVAAIVGKRGVAAGLNIIMSHIDSPHLDLKVNPLYEDENLAFFKTHYYGGIKKYHWPTIPLSLHGVVVLQNGKKIEIRIGEKDTDPIFMITDLLLHLSRQQLRKTIDEAIAGEELNILIGSMPVKDAKVKSKVKLAILQYLNDEYGIINEDFFSAEIQIVPQSKARDLGFDRSFVAAFGQDDRVCAYASLKAIIDSRPGELTQLCSLVDREEIGSEGNTGAQSIFLENFIADLSEKISGKASQREVFKILEKSRCLSSDVTAGLDPDYRSVHDPLNSARLGFGVALEKYTGHRGKSSTSEASAEYAAKIREMLNNKKIVWQTGGLGKVDEGGGGTIAMFMAKRNMEVIDIGVPLFNMHAPMEISSKADIYSAYLAYAAFYTSSFSL